MKRGDLVPIVRQGAYGKPRPALVIRADLFSEYPSVTILPITSELREEPLFRVSVASTEETGLRHKSQVMVDKIQTVPHEKAGMVFGRLSDEMMVAVNRALAVWLGFA